MVVNLTEIKLIKVQSSGLRAFFMSLNTYKAPVILNTHASLGRFCAGATAGIVIVNLLPECENFTAPLKPNNLTEVGFFIPSTINGLLSAATTIANKSLPFVEKNT